jgi:hypothetical protein
MNSLQVLCWSSLMYDRLFIQESFDFTWNCEGTLPFKLVSGTKNVFLNWLKEHKLSLIFGSYLGYTAWQNFTKQNTKLNNQKYMEFTSWLNRISYSI